MCYTPEDVYVYIDTIEINGTTHDVTWDGGSPNLLFIGNERIQVYPEPDTHHAIIFNNININVYFDKEADLVKLEVKVLEAQEM